MGTSISLSEAHSKLKKYCSYQERCHKEVRMKLNEMRMIPEAIDHIIVELIKDDYLNESRFAQSFVRGKFRIKKWGKQRLVSELRKRDISSANINRALKEINEEEYYKTFDQLARKRFNSLNSGKCELNKKKLTNYLLYRGWESQMVYEKVRELFKGSA